MSANESSRSVAPPSGLPAISPSGGEITLSADAVCVSLGFEADTHVWIKPLFWPGMVSLRLGALIGAVEPGNLARCLAHHPDQAVDLLLRHLDFCHAAPLAPGEFQARADRPVTAFYHGRLDLCSDLVSPRHGASPCPESEAPTHSAGLRRACQAEARS